MALTKVTSGVRTLGTGEVATANMATDPTNASNLSSGSVPLAQLGNVDTSGITANQDDIALLGFKVASNGSLAKYNLVDQTVDDFQDTSGVNASGSTNEVRDASGKYYKGEGAITPVVSGNWNSTGTDGDYSWWKWTTVTASGTFTTDTADDYEYLVIAGGGSGTGAAAHGVGAGGAGGYRTATGFPVAADTAMPITVGAGAASEYNGSGDKGSNSIFSTITSTGGGGGDDGWNPAEDGGSGGGGGSANNDIQGGSGNQGGYSPVEGYDGGDGVMGSDKGGGGGGGAGSAGVNGSGATGGNGGLGRTSSIDGTATFRGSGGGATAGLDPSPAGVGNPGGGGPGSNTGDGTPGTANTGGGGGASRASTNSGAGGSGIVIIRRQTSETGEGGNMTLVSTTTAAQAAPTKGDIVLTYTNGAGTTTLDTDLTAEISADGGSTWTALALGSEGSTGSHNIATSHDVTISSTITSPYNMAYRIKTLNQSVSKTTRIQAVSLGWS